MGTLGYRLCVLGDYNLVQGELLAAVEEYKRADRAYTVASEIELRDNGARLIRRRNKAAKKASKVIDRFWLRYQTIHFNDRAAGLFAALLSDAR